jgi:hypothetical protein
MMRIRAKGILNAGERGTARATSTFPSATALSDGSLIASYRVGSDKDSADETVELRRSYDLGATWDEPFKLFGVIIDGQIGSLKAVYLTPLDGAHVLACALWVDRQAHPGQPLFNAETEGCLPMAVLLADSHDCGRTWTPWREAPVTEDVGPPSLTSPVLRLANGELAISIESNKRYDDPGKWHQRVVYLFSRDEGSTWSPPYTVSQDPEARIFYWDQRAAVAPDGRILTLSWTFDRETNRYLQIQRRISGDSGRTWTPPSGLGFSDQPSHPAILPDGRVVVAWVDRYASGSIRARLAENIDGEFASETEVTIYCLEHQRAKAVENVGDALADMKVWSYGLPYAEPLPNGDVLVVYYAGDPSSMDIHWAQLSIN